MVVASRLFRLPPFGVLKILQFSTSCARKSHTIINDNIHGTVAISPICVKIIDTPQFQRLRHVKQLGYCDYVYPGANHSRFEHSIGVCYLAGQMARHLQEKIEKDIEIFSAKKDTEKDQTIRNDYAQLEEELKNIKMKEEHITCIEIAGLCHDIGHGPFSHLFDQMFYKDDIIIKDGGIDPAWKHETATIQMFQHMINVNDSLKRDLKQTLKVNDDALTKWVDFIKDLIIGKRTDLSADKPHYMFEIVANKVCEIDVDKMDYFARDCDGLGIKSDFDHRRYIQNSRVMMVDDTEGRRSAVCIRDKAVHDLYELFHTRNNLFRRALFHKVSKGIEYMINEALVAANDVLLLKNQNGEPTKMSKAWGDMYVYQQLTDKIIDHIVLIDDPKLEKSKDLINRIHNRDLYKSVYESPPKRVDSFDIKQLADDIITEDKNMKEEEKIKKDDKKEKKDKSIKKDDFLIKKFTYSYGKQSENPIKNVYFFQKYSDKSFKHDDPTKVSNFVPHDCFQETVIRVYSKHTKNEKDERQRLQKVVKSCAKSWIKNSD